MAFEELMGLFPKLLFSHGNGSTSRHQGLLIEVSVIPGMKVPLDEERVLMAIAERYNVSVAGLQGRDKTKNIALARQVAAYILVTQLKRSSSRVGRLLGRDHSTILHAVKVIEKRLRSDVSLVRDIRAITSWLRVDAIETDPTLTAIVLEKDGLMAYPATQRKHRVLCLLAEDGYTSDMLWIQYGPRVFEKLRELAAERMGPQSS
jgi:hypothetical protein